MQNIPAPKNHPAREEWISLLYGETGSEEKALLETHLAECSECRDQYDAWIATQDKLDSWCVPFRPSFSRSVPKLRWMAAAALFLILGIALGRMIAPQSD